MSSSTVQSFSKEHKQQARTLVRAMVLLGQKEKPDACEKCGKAHPDLDGHHPDYSKPSEVIWVCPSCHGKIHRKYPNGKPKVRKFKQLTKPVGKTTRYGKRLLSVWVEIGRADQMVRFATANKMLMSDLLVNAVEYAMASPEFAEKYAGKRHCEMGRPQIRVQPTN